MAECYLYLAASPGRGRSCFSEAASRVDAMFCWGSASSRKHTQQEFHTQETLQHKTPACRNLTDAAPGNAAANTSDSTTNMNKYARL